MLELARLMGLEEAGKASEQDAMVLRVMMPVANASEGLECFGGQGYIEDTGLPSILRDAQVLPIWEGTSSVMSLDVIRAIYKTKGEAVIALKSHVDSVVNGARHVPALVSSSDQVSAAMADIVTCVQRHQDNIQTMARDLTVSIAHTYIAALLLEHAMVTMSASDIHVANTWCSSRKLCTISLDQSNYNSQAC